MKNIFILIFVFILSCINKNVEMNQYSEKYTKQINLDSLITYNEQNMFFLSFWNGMNTYLYDTLIKIENSKSNLNDKVYKFLFDNKLNLEVPFFENTKILQYELELTPKFEDSRLVSLELRRPFKSLSDDKLITHMKQEKIMTLREKEYLEIERKESKIKGSINNYCIDQIINLYIDKYSNPKILKGDYNQIFKTEPKVLYWEINNKLIFISYYDLGHNSKSLDFIKYIDKEYYKREDFKRLKTIDSLVNKTKNHI